jgi:hypothetical protein
MKVRYADPEVIYAGDSWLPRWLWHPTRIEPPENSGETVIRFVCNLLRVSLAIFVIKLVLLFCAFVMLLIFAVCSGALSAWK